MLKMTGRTAGPIKTKLGIGTHVDPRSVLVKVKVIWLHLVNANKTPYKGRENSICSGRVGLLTASILDFRTFLDF